MKFLEKWDVLIRFWWFLDSDYDGDRGTFLEVFFVVAVPTDSEE